MRNAVDINAEMDSLKNSVDQLDKDLSLIRQSIPLTYKHLLVNPKLLIAEPIKKE